MIHNKNFFITFAVSLIFINSCNAQIKDLEKFFKDEYLQLNLLYYQKGNLTSLGDQEYIVFYEDPKQVNTDHPQLKNIDKVVVFSLKKYSLIKKFEMEDVWSFGYDDFHLRILNRFQINKQKWNGFCLLSDFNNNGLDEILFFTLSGLSFQINIFEFHYYRFENVLKYPSSTSLSKIEAKQNGRRTSFIIYDEGGPKITDDKRNWYRMEWNDKKNKYEVVEQGIQDWYDPKTGKMINE